MNAGILLPRSNAHPEAGLDFMDGLRAFLKQQELKNQVQFFSEHAGYGAVEKEVYEKVEKLLIIDDVDILLAYIDEKMIPVLAPLLNASGKLMIVINPGANYSLDRVLYPNIIHLTLQHAFLCWLTGAWAGKGIDKNALMATTFYDCGYLHTTAMVKNFAKQGGNITFNYVNNQLYNESFHINELTNFLRGNKETHNLLCVFDDLPASLFYNRLYQFEEAGRLHLFVSPMMLEPKALEEMHTGYPFAVRGYLPWMASAENEENRNFIKAYGQHTKRSASFFSLLGWETGMILEQILRHCKMYYTDGTAIVQTLSKIKMNSPRGLLQLDVATHYFLAPVCRCFIKQKSVIVETECVANYEDEWRAFVNETTTGVVSGWTNTYLCY